MCRQWQTMATTGRRNEPWNGSSQTYINSIGWFCDVKFHFFSFFFTPSSSQRSRNLAHLRLNKSICKWPDQEKFPRSQGFSWKSISQSNVIRGPRFYVDWPVLCRFIKIATNDHVTCKWIGTVSSRRNVDLRLMKTTPNAAADRRIRTNLLTPADRNSTSPEATKQWKDAATIIPFSSKCLIEQELAEPVQC